MQEVLREVLDGSFGKELMAEFAAGAPEMTRLMDEARAHDIEAVGARLRALSQK